VGRRHPADGAVLLHHVDGAAVGQGGHRQPGHAFQGHVGVQGGGQRRPRLRQEALGVLAPFALGNVEPGGHRPDDAALRIANGRGAGPDGPTAAVGQPEVHLFAPDLLAAAERADQRPVVGSGVARVREQAGVGGVLLDVGGPIRVREQVRPVFVAEDDPARGGLGNDDAAGHLLQDRLQEAALRLQLLEEPFALRLRRLALGDVPRDSLDAHGPAVPHDQSAAHLQRHAAAVFADDLQLIRRRRRFAGQLAPQGVAHPLVVLRRHEFRGVAAQAFLPRISEHLLRPLVDGGDASFQVQCVDDVVGVLEQVAVALLAFAQRGLGRTALVVVRRRRRGHGRFSIPFSIRQGDHSPLSPVFRGEGQ